MKQNHKVTNRAYFGNINVLGQIHVVLLQQDEHLLINDVLPVFLELRESVDALHQLRIGAEEELVESAPHRETGEGAVVHQSGPEVRDLAWIQVAAVLVNVTRDEEVEYSVAEELEALVRVGHAIRGVRGMREGLQKVGRFFEAVAEALLDGS